MDAFLTALPIFLALCAALLTTVLFAYGAWTLLREPAKAHQKIRELARALHLIRHDENPIITPGGLHWEAQGVLNPAAVDVDGRIHLFYRAIGNDGVSRIGYASSESGKDFDRLPYPVFALAGEPPEAAMARARAMQDHDALVASGGSWGGVEDPRAVVIDDRMYLSFSAFAGWDSLRIGLTSLALEDLRAKRWRWTPPVYLSPRGQVHKNWVLFPEKIREKFALLHSLHSGSRARVVLDYLDTLHAEPKAPIRSPYVPKPDQSAWDTTLRGAGPPPIKTEKGWLLLYHAIDHREPSRYKLGALLLDRDNPSRIISRSKAPVLAPDARYENDGAKPGIVYACGAVVRGDALTVYYGGSDSVICAAKHSLSKLLSLLVPASEVGSPSFFAPPLVMQAAR